MAFGILKTRPKLFCGIVLVYAVLTVVLVKGLSSSVDISFIRENVQLVLDGNWGKIAASMAIFGVLVGNAGSASSDVAAIIKRYCSS